MKRKKKMSSSRKAGIDLGLTEEEKKALRAIAVHAIEAKLSGMPLPDITPGSDTLKEKRGAFVTLHKKGALRGCIGYIQTQHPLYKTVQEMAIAAAFSDPRFDPLRPEEFPEVDLEISVLTPFRQISDIEEIEVGKHGLMIVKENRSGLLLPQVATEYNWDKETFLQHTCTKAGLEPLAWKDKETQLYIFSADIF